RRPRAALGLSPHCEPEDLSRSIPRPAPDRSPDSGRDRNPPPRRCAASEKPTIGWQAAPASSQRVPEVLDEAGVITLQIMHRCPHSGEALTKAKVIGRV